MKNTLSILQARALMSIFAISLLLMNIKIASAAPIFTWDGAPDGGGSSADANWSNADNWVGDVVPSSGDELVFPPGAAQLTNNNDFVGELFDSITFSGNGYNLQGQSLGLVGGGVIDSASGGTNTIDLSIDFSGTQPFEVTESNESLIFNGDIRGGELAIDGDGTIDFTGTIEDLGPLASITKNGAGLVILEGTNSYGGTTVINNGSLSIESVLALGATDGLAATGTVVNDGGQLVILGSPMTISNELLELNGLGYNGNGALGSGSSGHIWDGNVVLATDSRIAVVSTNLVISGVISGPGTLEKSGAGTLILSGANTYTGNTQIDSGTIQTAADNVIPDVSDVHIEPAVVDTAGGTLNLNGNDDTIATLALLPGHVSTGAGTLTLGGTVSGTSNLVEQSTIDGNLSLGGVDRTFDVVDDNYDPDLLISAVISDGGPASGIIISGGRMGLNGVNTYTGVTTVLPNSFLTLLGNDGLGSTIGGTEVMTNGNITIVGSKTISGEPLILNTTSAVGALSEAFGDSTWGGNITLASDTKISTYNSTDSLTITGTISGIGGFTKNLDGDVILSSGSGNTYAGDTIINDGRVFINNDQNDSDVTFTGTGTLGGDGTVGGLAASNAGIVSPGNSPAILSTDDSVTFDATSSFNVEINGTVPGTNYDQLNVNGNVDLGGSILNFTPGYTPVIGDSYTIIQASGTITGTFNGFPDGKVFIVSGKKFQIHYNTNSVVIENINGGGGGGGGSSGNGGNSGSSSSSTQESDTQETSETSEEENVTQESSDESTQETSETEENESSIKTAKTHKEENTVVDDFYLDIKNHWAQNEIVRLKNECKVAGYANEAHYLLRQFRPDQPITRAELFTMIVKCKVGPLAPPENAPFTDLNRLHWAAPYIAKAMELAMIKGYPDGTFKPDDSIDRANGLKIILLAWIKNSEIESASANDECVDMVQTQWYAKFFNYALVDNLIHGYTTAEGTKFCAPSRTMTRAEAASLIIKLKDQVTEAEES